MFRSCWTRTWRSSQHHYLRQGHVTQMISLLYNSSTSFTSSLPQTTHHTSTTAGNVVLTSPLFNFSVFSYLLNITSHGSVCTMFHCLYLKHYNLNKIIHCHHKNRTITMRTDAALPQTCTFYMIYFGEISLNLHVFHFHDYLQEHNCGVNQEVHVISSTFHGNKSNTSCVHIII